MEVEKRRILRALIKEEYSNVTGIVILKNNEPQLETYFERSNHKEKIQIASVTKSIMAAVVSIAIDKGAIKDIDQQVLTFFSEYEIKKREKTI